MTAKKKSPAKKTAAKSIPVKLKRRSIEDQITMLRHEVDQLTQGNVNLRTDYTDQLCKLNQAVQKAVSHLQGFKNSVDNAEAERIRVKQYHEGRINGLVGDVASARRQVEAIQRTVDTLGVTRETIRKELATASLSLSATVTKIEEKYEERFRSIDRTIKNSLEILGKRSMREVPQESGRGMFDIAYGKYKSDLNFVGERQALKELLQSMGALPL